MYYQSSPLERLRDFFMSSAILPKFIFINVGVWLAIKIIAVFVFFASGTVQAADLFFVRWLALPAGPGSLIFKPWTLISYMFLHLGFWHLLFNMLWLFWFGQIFLQFLNTRQLVFNYIVGGLMGALFFIIFYNTFSNFPYINATLMGASASVLAIVVAVSAYSPNTVMHLLFLGPVKIKYIAIFSVLLSFINIPDGNAGGNIAHLGGAFAGYLFAYFLKKGNDLSAIFAGFRLPGFSGGSSSRKKHAFRNVHININPMTDEEYNERKLENQRRVDIILEKIKRSGYDSLNKEEKEFLFRSSRK
jgi:membrane associated rhomboid family serine protease